MDPRRLILHLPTLSHHRWAAPVLAELDARDGAKFITLINSLGIPRDSLSRTLEALIHHGWAARNPGYGHPLRPEYIPTPAGRRVGERCAALLARADRAGPIPGTVAPVSVPAPLADTLLRKWTMPTMLAIRFGGERFSDLRDLMPAATARALSLTLERAELDGLVTRSLDTARAPRPVYALSRRGERIMPPMIEVAHAVAATV